MLVISPNRTMRQIMRKLTAALALCIVLCSVAAPANADHPRLRKLAKIAGIGALTGGIGAAVLGGSVASGAAMGAGTHVGFHQARNWWHRHQYSAGARQYVVY